MKKLFKSISRVVICLLVLTIYASKSHAQTASIAGPTTVETNSVNDYVLTYNGGITSLVWDLGTGGVLISTANTGFGQVTATVKWTSAGAKYVEAVVQGSKGSVIVGMGVTVFALCTTLSAGGISGGDVTICVGSARTLTLAGISGGDGDYDYQWKSRLGSSGTFNPLAGETSASYTVPSTMIDDSEYMVEVTSCAGSEIDYTSSVYVNYMETVAGTMTAGSAQICGTQIVNFELIDHSGTIIKWRERYKDGEGTWSAWSTFEETDDISVLDHELLAWSGGQRTYEIKAMVKEGSCNTKHPKVQVIVDPLVADITASQSQICCSEQVTFSLPVNMGYSIEEWSYSYRDGSGQWSTFETITENNAMTIFQTLNPSGTTENREYEIRALVASGSCSSSKSSFVTVIGDITPAGFTAGNDLTVFQNSGLIGLHGSGESPSGIWSGDLVANGDFDTDDAIAGSNSITYTYTDPISECEVSATKNVLVIASPVVSSSNGTTISLGTSNELSVVSVFGYTYQWTKDGTDIAGATLASFTVNVPGTYAARITAPNSQVLNTSNFVIIDAGLAQNQNMVRTRTYRVPTSDPTSLKNVTEISESFGYFDGLGRPLQSVISSGSPTQRDVVSVVEYDEFGRQIKDYLPYSEPTSSSGIFRTDAMTEQSMFSEFGGDTVTYSEKKLEASPLSRVLEQAAPGTPWKLESNGSGRTVKLDYDVNEGSEVRIWQIVNDAPSSSGFYSAAELYKNTTTDEDDNQSITFTNKQRQTILKKVQVDSTTWADTYYVYDIYNNLRTVLPPELSKSSPGFGPWNPSLSDLKDWAFAYEYDSRNRMIAKQVPGADTVYMVYDQWDRLVLTQDGNQRCCHPEALEGEAAWLFTKYDELNRPIITGILTDTDDISTMRTTVANVTTRFDTLNTSLAQGYSNDAYPSITGTEILTVTYYDSYDFMLISGQWPSGSNPGFDYFDEGLTETVNGHTYDLPDTLSVFTKGQVTGSKTRKLQGSDFIKTVSYYDDKYRVIQTISTNVKGGFDRVSNLYDFIGQVLESKTVHYDSDTDSSPQEITRRFEFDHGGRLLKTYHDIDGEGEVLLSSNSYDELSQLTEKNLHASDIERMQSVDYAYNIRGWLIGINDSGLTEGDGDLFGMELHYDTNPIDGTKTFFNGNIGGMEWSDYNESSTRAYAYDYDKLNRLKAANAEGGTGTNAFSVPTLDYDLNGNILELERVGDTNNALIDELDYTYLGNQLLTVTDANTSDSTTFIDGNTSGNDYTYDANGNMVKDLNKGIDSIYYNHLNLPAAVVFNAGDSISYHYDAAGIKLKQEVFNDNDSLLTKREYVGEFYYENDTLKFINHEEGRVVVDVVNAELDYQYHLKDHLGNTRLTFSTTPESYTRIATMEDASSASEEAIFENISDTRVSMAAANHTTGGTKASRVPNTDPVGPMALMQVNKGDTINLHAWSYYEGDGSVDALINQVDLLAMLVSGYEASTGITEASSAVESALDDALDFPENTVPKTNTTNDDAPKAYINYLLFDEEMAFITSGFKQISSGSMSLQQVIMDPIVIDKECLPAGRQGYVMVYVSNESSTIGHVHFDDFTVTHSKTPVVQADDYYPFGLTFNSFSRNYSEKVRFKFQEQEHDEETGWIAFKWRNHQPEIGRFFNVDPLAEKYVYNSPYAFAENRVIDGRELEGLEWVKSTEGNEIHYSITVKVRNSAGIPESSAVTVASLIADQVESSFQGADSDGNNYSTSVNIDFSSDGTEGDFFIDLVDKVVDDEGNETEYAGKVDGDGTSQVNRIQVDVTGRDGLNDIVRTGAHEVGHSGGLEHAESNVNPKKTTDGLPIGKDNIMIQSSYGKGTKVNGDQLKDISETIDEDIK